MWPRVGHHAERGAQPEDAAVAGRHPNGPAEVAAEVQPGKAGRDGGCGAAGGAAGRTGGVPGVVRRAEDRVEGLRLAGIRRGVGLADDDCTCGPQPGDRDGVPDRDVLGELGHAARGADAGGLEGVLDGDRQPVQRPERLAASGGLVGGRGLVARPLLVEGDDGVDPVVELGDSSQVELEQLPSTDLAAAQGGRQGCRTRERVGHGDTS